MVNGIEVQYIHVAEREPGTSMGVMFALFLHMTGHCYNLHIVASQTVL